MTKQPNLRLPGPTPVPEDIMQAVGHPMINHRGREFAGVIERCAERLKDFFLTKKEVLILSLLRHRWPRGGGRDQPLARRQGARRSASARSATASRPSRRPTARTSSRCPTNGARPRSRRTSRSALKADPDINAVLVTHNETSTGVTNPLEEIAAVVREARQAAHRRRREQSRRDPIGHGRLGPRRRRDRLAEGLDGATRACVRVDERPRLGSLRQGEDAALLPGPRTAPRRAAEGPDAVGRRRCRSSLASTSRSTAWPRRVSSASSPATRECKRDPRWREGARPRIALCEDEQFASDTVTAVKAPEGVEVERAAQAAWRTSTTSSSRAARASSAARSSASATSASSRKNTSPRRWTRWHRRCRSSATKSPSAKDGVA